MKTSQIIAAYATLSAAKLTKMEGEGKIKVVKAVMEMKPIHAAYADFVDETLKRLKPEWMDGEKEKEWRSKGTDSDSLTSTEKSEAQQYMADADNCLKDEFTKDHKLTFKKLSDKEFQDFAESNDFTAGQLIELMSVLQ